jgi:spore maturation protein SpmB
MTSETGPGGVSGTDENCALTNALTADICREAFSLLGTTPEALDLLAMAVLSTDAIEGSAESMLAAGAAPVPVTGGP